MLYIDGTWQHAITKNTHAVINPATEEKITDIAYGNDEDVLLAIDAAARAFPAWKYTTPYERAAILKATAEHIRVNVDKYAIDTVKESGKPLIEAKGEWMVAANLFEWYAEECKRSYGRTIPAAKKDKRMSVIYQAVGVVGTITAWNFPVYNPARCWAAALAAGCCVVGKPSETTPISAINITASLIAAGIPKGVLNLVVGDADSIGKLFLKDARIKKISFTGSTRVGKLLIEGAAQTNTKLALEMGGNAPVIIMDDVDVPTVAQGLVTAKLRNCGQVCVAPQRVYVHQKIYPAFVEQVKQHLNTLSVGNGLDATSHIGPMINLKQKHWVETLLTEAQQEKGASIHQHPFKADKGYFIPPTMVYNISHRNVLCHKEIFGPLIPLIPFSSKEDVVQWANDTPYGLAAYIWTNHLQTAYYLSERLECGMVGINEWAVQSVEAPFGGWKESGIGHECGSEGLLEYMEKKLVSIGGML